METTGTEALRHSAPEWSLAGDKQLLDLLKSIHEKIITKSQEASNQLDLMVCSLDSASISLQNVNNRFMALSNSQFIESRVYDDDTDIANDNTDAKVEAKKTEAPSQPTGVSEESQIAQSLTALEMLHEEITILGDSDSDTDDGMEDSVILRPRDMYGHRPLPHTIGSQLWKTKWHAGLVIEDSDTDSAATKPDIVDDEYSDSDVELDKRTDKLAVPPRTYRSSAVLRPSPNGSGPNGASADSTTSSDLCSEQELPGSVPSTATKPTQSDIAAELARRLGGHLDKPSDLAATRREDFGETATRPLYRPHQPAASSIFFDEPPPLDPTQKSDSEDALSDGDDIFAELHTSAPNAPRNKTQGNHQARDMFEEQAGTTDDAKRDFNVNRSRVEGSVTDIDRNVSFKDGMPQSPSVAKPKTTLFDDEEDSELFTDKPVAKPFLERPADETDAEIPSVKKPTGAISLFGSKEGAESIGAAILRRNRKVSHSEEDSDNSTEEIPETPAKLKTVNNKTIVSKVVGAKSVASPIETSRSAVEAKETLVKQTEAVVKPKEKDIFDDLFAKSERSQKPTAESKKPPIKVESKKVDLFSDNIFDDVDDLFTSNVTVKTLKTDNSKVKSLFDDVDDLFADIDDFTAKSDVKIVTSVKKPNGLFDDDDDLFYDKNSINNVISTQHDTKTSSTIAESQDTNSELLKTNKSASTNLVSDDDELFSGEQSTNTKSESKPEKSGLTGASGKITIVSLKSKDKVGKKGEEIVETNKVTSNKTKGLFDSDDDNDDIFNNISPPKLPQIVLKVQSVERSETSDNNKFEKHSTFEAQREVENKVDILYSDTKNESKEVDATVNKKIETIQTDLGKSSKNVCVQISNANNPINSLIDEGDNLFKQSTRSEVKSLKSPSIFEDSTNEDLFTKNKASQNKNNISHSVQENDKKLTATQSLLTATSAPSSNIFGEEDDDIENDLFAKIKKSTDVQQPKQLSETSNEKGEAFKYNETKQSHVTLTNNISRPEENESIITSENIKTVKNNVETKTKTSKQTSHNDNLFTSGENSSSNQKDNVADKKQFFDDIFAEPPAFEKPKEPKRSKNVNALFDDDSDDENLFFKKNDLLEEIPVDFSPTVDKPFDIFHNEPPAIDLNADEIISNQQILNKASDKTIEQSETENKKENLNSIFSEAKDETVVDKIDGKISNETKTVGKLKPMKFNINVNTLLPGASPKKTAKTKEIESPILSDGESKLVKSVSFDSDTDSLVLNNNISKERAKIQVKRRPSSRRARIEAVRKSAIDLNPDKDDIDFSDNNASLKDNAEKTQNEEIQTQNKSPERKTQILNIIDDDVYIFRDPYASEPEEIKHKHVEPVVKEKGIDNFEEKPRSKVLSILNDDDNDDLFKTPNKSQQIEYNRNENAKTDDNIAREIPNKTETIPKVNSETMSTVSAKPEVSTIEDIPKSDVEAKAIAKSTKISLFDDLSDEDDLFGANNTKKATQSAFSNADSDEELFGSASSRNVFRSEAILSANLKTSLFDDTDDDMFGSKVKTKEQTPQKPSQPKRRESPPPSEAVFDDPLSLLGNDDDD